jgi:hypothetical protein
MDSQHVRNFDVYTGDFNADKLRELFHSILEGKDRDWRMSPNEMPPVEQIIDKINSALAGSPRQWCVSLTRVVSLPDFSLLSFILSR